jgi:hypothetical protein
MAFLDIFIQSFNIMLSHFPNAIIHFKKKVTLCDLKQYLHYMSVHYSMLLLSLT